MHASGRLQAVLERLDLVEYADIFRKEKIDDGNLHLLTEAYLREIGIPLGPALQIMDALRDSRPTQGGSSVASWPLPPLVGVQFATSSDQRQITVLYCDIVQSTELTQLLGKGRLAYYGRIEIRRGANRAPASLSLLARGRGAPAGTEDEA